jgi:hypothetical protein
VESREINESFSLNKKIAQLGTTQLSDFFAWYFRRNSSFTVGCSKIMLGNKDSAKRFSIFG